MTEQQAVEDKTHHASRRLVLWVAALAGVAVLLAGTGTIIALFVSIGNKHGLTTLINQQAAKSKLRDQQRDATEKQIRDLADTVRTGLNNTNNAICALLIGSIQANTARGMPTSQIVFTFAASIKCVIPKSVLIPPTNTH